MDSMDLQKTLKEWFRVLKPGGALYVSVPDLDILSKLFVDPKLNSNEKFQVMRMIYGGQIDENDYHKVGFNFEILKTYVLNAGFCEVKRVINFGLFDDTSRAEFKGKKISLNIQAKACKTGKQIEVEIANI